MAWYKRYRIPFQSLRQSTQYMVYIYEQTDGELVTLTGSADPFVTQEDSDDDVFMPMRKQTGYIEVLDTTGGTLMEEIIPANNTEKMVKLYTGTWNNSMTTFTDGEMKWQGFMCAEAFSQPWDGGKNILQFPVKSLLAALEDVQLPEALTVQSLRSANLITQGIAALCGNDYVPYTTVYFMDDLAVSAKWMGLFVNYATFYSEEIIENQNDQDFEYVGQSYFEALGAMLSFIGVTARECGGVLMFGQYDDKNYTVKSKYVTWSDVVSMAAGGAPITSLPEDITDTPILSALSFAGTDNTAGYMQGGRSAKVVLSFGGLTLKITLPHTTESDDAPVEFNLYHGKLYIQPHGPRVSHEGFSYFEYKRNQLQGESTYEDMLPATVFNGYYPNPYRDKNYSLYTGAFPIRWFYREDDERVMLRNGLYINTQYRVSVSNPGSITQNLLYRIDSRVGVSVSDGWLRIDFKWLNIIFNSTLGKYLFTDAASFYQMDVMSEIHMCLRVGDKWWNGSAWVVGSAPTTNFFFNVKNDTIVTNKTSDMNIDEDDGYFIPVNEQLNGDVSFYILNFVPVKLSNGNYEYCYSHILCDLMISHVRPISIVASERGSNTYRQSILESGFRDDKSIDLRVGTYNNNTWQPCFITEDGVEYLQVLDYRKNGETVAERPEMHLLGRMAEQYNEVRRAFKAVAVSGIDLLLQRFTYISRKFFGVDYRHNWRDDEQEIKFIEVT